MAKGRPKGSRNKFRGGKIDHQELVRTEYGTAWDAVVRMRKAHVRKKGGCHVCAEAIENRLLGKPPQEIKPAGGTVTPMMLVTITGVTLSEAQKPVEMEVAVGQTLLLPEGVEWPDSS